MFNKKIVFLNHSHYFWDRPRMYAVPNMAVFSSSLTSRFPGMLLMYFLNGFEIVPVAPIITGIIFVFTFYYYYYYSIYLYDVVMLV